MPLYMDRHDVPGTSAAEVAAAHEMDLGVQTAYGVRYLTYWFDADLGSLFCLAEGPNMEAVDEVHRNGHGFAASKIIEVEHAPIDAFFAPLPDHPAGEAYTESAIRAILFTDICDSTEQTQRFGDDVHMAVLRDHDTIVRNALDCHGGREVKHTGDGIMASFSSVSSSVAAAVLIEQDLQRRQSESEHELRVRIGISAGEPVTENEDLFGAAVQLASRLCSCSEPAGITVSVAVRELCIGKHFEFEDRQPVTLKGFPEPVQVYGVRW